MNWVVQTGTWNGPLALTAPGIGRSGQVIGTVRQGDDQIDVLFVDNAGAVTVMWATGVSVWQGPVVI